MVIIKNARIFSMEGLPFEYGDIAIEGKKIYDVKLSIEAKPCDDVIDATGLIAMPGMIDAHCHLGMWEDGIGEEGADGNESTDPVTPQLRAIDAINPLDRSFEEARQHGVTTVMTGPGSANVLSGMFVSLKTKGECVDDMIIMEPAAAKAAFGENPKRVYSDQKKSPKTRMATAAILRQALVDAQGYMDKAKSDEKSTFSRDLKMEALAKVLNKEIPLKCHAHRADDLQTAIRIGKEFDIMITLEHCTEGHLMLDQLKKEGVKVVLGPLFTERAKVEMKNLSLKAPAMFEKAGIPFALMTDHPVIPIQHLPVSAALAVREGLSEKAALEAITINAAKVMGIEHRIGSIKEGKDADVVLFNGHPLDMRSRVVRVYINGECVHTA